MANKKQKTMKRSTGEWLYCSFQAHPEEIAKWREIAGGIDRSLSWWIRYQLNKAAGIGNGAENGKDNEKTSTEGQGVPLEKISSDRPRSDFEG